MPIDRLKLISQLADELRATEKAEAKLVVDLAVSEEAAAAAEERRLALQEELGSTKAQLSRVEEDRAAAHERYEDALDFLSSPLDCFSATAHIDTVRAQPIVQLRLVPKEAVWNYALSREIKGAEEFKDHLIETIARQFGEKTAAEVAGQVEATLREAFERHKL